MNVHMTAGMKTGTALIPLILFSLLSCATGGIRYAENHGLEDYERRIRQESSENLNGLFPETVHIKTLTQSFNTYYDFQLYDGKIYYKGRDGRSPEDWSLLKKGLPRRPLDWTFTRPRAVRAIAADANLLTALSDEGVFYFMMCTRELTAAPFEWIEKKGFPTPMTLRLDEDVADFRGWGMGRRGSEVLWYEDINGNRHHYGTMGIQHNYMLMADGREIRFSDTGLPADFSHNLLGPERGRFTAEGISASGCTVFLINRAGEMYTRLADFDSLGSDPMFYKYSYDRSYRDFRPGSDYDTNFNPWALPSEDWRRQPEIPLEGEAALSGRITICQNGRGNAARELRVAGLDARGETGYYSKEIFDSSWSFRPVKLDLEGELFESVPAEERAALRGPSADRDLPGRLWTGGRADNEEDGGVSVRLEGFNLLEGSCTLRVSDGDESLGLAFHPVEMWYYMKRFRPGRDGSYKLMFATLEINSFSLSRPSPSFQQKLLSRFAPYDGNTFALFLEASEGYVLLRSNGNEEPELQMLFSDRREDLEADPEELRRTVLFRNDPLIALYEGGSLLPEEPADLENSGALLDLIHRNERYLELLKEARKEAEDRSFSSGLSQGAYRGAEVVFTLTGLRFVDYPKIKTVTMHFDTIVDRINESVSVTRESRLRLYRQLEERVKERIEIFQAIRRGERPPLYEEALVY